jgi:methylmalonyl-CoA/ethylmalonyl-CoA epimerase
MHLQETPMTGLARIRQIAVTVDDVKRAVPFYRDTLGMRLLFEAPPNFAFFDCDGVRLMLAPPEGEFAAGSVLYFHTDIQASHDALAARGVAFKSAPHVRRQAAGSQGMARRLRRR